ncbi:type I-E CRISPR-associated protein Cas6/Cse3/CasE [Telmatospirillum sp.]|uniref:type I-E CRISPR-associated protein Cas6/Cse3/CasE n=1 Tax=Telmatospirillum sp. TaxID=2079197 RepID=UPI00283ABD35|nr:type I-E CRISPR-associated protein Cas6/Cse3/CasE [Telmatospirillum sp.]MDR3439158.1 type I-E CRISPR-associated protein Cas6/Cse3/CasE [Telmatospirillum sp.]
MSYLTLAELRRDTPQARDQARQAAISAHRDAGHRLIWSLFNDDPGAKRDFLYRTTADNRFLIVSARPPRAAEAVWRLKTKAYAPDLTAGQRLGFSLRANPSVALSQPDRRRSKRLDIFQYHKLASPGPIDPQTREDIALEWLAGKLAPLGATVDRTLSQLAGHTQLRLDGKKALLTAIDIEGVLTVTAPGSFVPALTEGIGHGKAFGLGLILLRPLGPPARSP